MATLSISAAELKNGMVLALPFGRSVEIFDVIFHTKFVAYKIKIDGKPTPRRISIGEEVLIEVNDPPEKMYLVCGGCGEAFDTIETALQHESAGDNAQFGHEYTIQPESEAM